MKPVRFHVEAAIELNKAFDYYDKISGIIANAFWNEANTALLHIGQNSEAYIAIYQKHRKYILHKFPFAIIYFESHDCIFKVAFMHQKRKPGYWKRRTKNL